MKTHILRMASATFMVALLPNLTLAQDCTPDARRVVDAIYRQVLERNANGEGAMAVTQLGAGQTTVRELVRNMAKSQEHIRRFMAGDRNNDVMFAYRHLLGREPDPGGLAAHVRVLETESPSAVLDNIIDSSEYQQLYSDDTVPGAKLRYCGAGGATSSNMRFRGMDRNGNGVIERTEWNGSAQSFTVHDWNNDGSLSREEVRMGGRRAGRMIEAEDDFNPAARRPGPHETSRCSIGTGTVASAPAEWYYAPEYFRRADRDRNGSLSAAEFTGGAATAATTWDDDRDDSFDNLDANNNDRVEQGEWHGSLDAFEWLDRNRDKWLSRAEVVGETTAQSEFDSFVSLDYNKSNSLEFPEWRWSRRSFDGYDTNRDGRLSRQEFAAKGGAPTASK